MKTIELSGRAQNDNSGDAVIKSEKNGNSAALHEALKAAEIGLFRWLYGSISRDEHRELVATIKTALAAPPRNCDVGTAEEQEQRFRKFCKMDYISEDCPDDCPLNRKDYSTIHCPFDWAQLPYVEKEVGAK